MKKAVRLIVQGTVQGVFFRQFCQENADKLQLRGFARNLENGDVEIILEGEPENILKMIEECKKGPAHSNIRNVKIEERKYSGDFTGFRVLRF